MKGNPSEHRAQSNDNSSSRTASEMADCSSNRHPPRQADRQNGRSERLALLGVNPAPSVSLSEDHIRSVLAARRARNSILGEGLFSDPAWDILLELYAAKLGHRRTSTEELARASGTPLSTTNRWITALERHGLARYERDQREGACVRISLTPEGASRMERLANQWGSASVSV